MNYKILAFLSALSVAALVSGCDSPAARYPMTYQVPIGNSTVSNAYGPQNLVVNATQDISVQPGMPFYYQIVSPVSLNLYVFDKTGPGPGGTMLGQLQGTAVTSQVTPQTGTLEFVFSAAQANTGGTVQFTVSDHPITPSGNSVMMPTVMPPPQTQTTTTQTTTTVTPAMPNQ